MTWVRMDDQMPINRKVAPLSDAAFRLQAEAICWSSRNLTDGVITADDLAEISKRGKPKSAAELVGRRLWHEAGADCPSPKCPPSGPNGWVIHDYLEYQPSREKVLREKEAKSERQRRWVEAQQAKRRPKEASLDASQDAPRDGPEDVTPSPPRPAPKEGGGGAPAGTAARRAAAGAGGGGRNNQTPATHPSPKCPLHMGQPAHNCALCRAEQLAAS